MPWLTQSLHQYFQSSCYGMTLALPKMRQINRPFLTDVYEALSQEEHLTTFDLKHLKTLIKIADSVPLPKWRDLKSLVDTEVFLIKSLPEGQPKSIRYCLEYLYYLFSRHGMIQEEEKTSLWLSIWRLTQRFSESEQDLITHFIFWMLQNKFSPISILDRLRAFQKFKLWLATQENNALNQMTAHRLSEYLSTQNYQCKASTTQKLAVNLQTFFDFYREQINGALPIFSPYSIPSSTGFGMAANSKEIEALWAALKSGKLPSEQALMLIFIIGMGLPLKALPLLKLTQVSNKLVYTFQRPNRQGMSEHEIVIPVDEPWILIYWSEYLKTRVAPKTYTYLFTSLPAIKKRQPVSTDYCQRAIQHQVYDCLGYSLPANRLERGSLNNLARKLKLSIFMERIHNVPLSKRTKLMILLNQQNSSKPYLISDTVRQSKQKKLSTINQTAHYKKLPDKACII